jgi:hypothetical protein
MTAPDPKHPAKHGTPPAPRRPEPPEHEGAVEAETGGRSGPGAGYDNEPKKVNDKGGVAPS